MDKKELYIIVSRPIIPNEHIVKEWKERMDKWADIKLRENMGGNIAMHKSITL